MNIKFNMQEMNELIRGNCIVLGGEYYSAITPLKPTKGGVCIETLEHKPSIIADLRGQLNYLRFENKKFAENLSGEYSRHKETKAKLAKAEKTIYDLKETLKVRERANQTLLELRRKEKEDYNKKLMELSGLHPGDKVLLRLFEEAKEDIERLQLKAGYYEKVGQEHSDRLIALEVRYENTDQQTIVNKREIGNVRDAHNKAAVRLASAESKIEQIMPTLT